jgi:hypothetical protein
VDLRKKERGRRRGGREEGREKVNQCPWKKASSTAAPPQLL